MKITRLEILPARLSRRVYVYVRLHTDSGIAGIGESACSRKERALIGALRDIEHYLIGADPFEIRKIWSIIYRHAHWRGGPVIMGALSGVEHALWEIKAKALDVPVWELLGGRYRSKVKVYTHVEGETPQQCADHALKLLKQGWRAFKLVPFEPTGPGFDIAHGKKVEAKVRAVREAVGDSVPIAVDCHGRLNPVNALEMASVLEPYGVYFFEEPVLPEYVGAMAELRRRVKVPIATGERLFTRYPFREYLVQSAVDVVQPDVCTVGGILEAASIASMAEAFYVSVAPHNPLSPLCTAISLHLDTVIPNFLVQEVSSEPQGRADLLVEPVEVVQDGYMKVPRGAGWGVTLNDKFIEAHPFESVAASKPVRFDEDGSVLDL